MWLSANSSKIRIKIAHRQSPFAKYSVQSFKFICVVPRTTDKNQSNKLSETQLKHGWCTYTAKWVSFIPADSRGFSIGAKKGCCDSITIIVRLIFARCFRFLATNLLLFIHFHCICGLFRNCLCGDAECAPK